MKKDIETRDDVRLMVDTFYQKVKQSPVIGYIFDDVAKIDWDKHLPIMYSFWSSILLNEHSYGGGTMIKHINLSRKTELNREHFSEWILLFNQTLDELFDGPKSHEAKQRAEMIAGLMISKIIHHHSKVE